MNQYKDFNYCKYIFSLPYKQGKEIFYKCLGRLNDYNKEIFDNRLWDLYLFELNNGYEGNFQEYKDRQEFKIENKIMADNEKDKEEKRIVDDIQKIIELDKRRKINV